MPKVFALGFTLVALLAAPCLSTAQGTFTPGTREILALSFANAQPGVLPAGLRLVNGMLDVVDQNGIRVVRSTTPAEFLVTLPEVLPQDFTIEFDLIPKACGCGEDELAFDGTSGTWSGSFARVQWGLTTQTVSGGGPPFTATTPATLRETLAGQLTTIIASFEGNTLKLYTNGQRLYTLSDRLFARGRVLRVILGGQNDGDQAVYLARLRVAAGAGSLVVATQQASQVTGTNPSSGGTIQAIGAAPPPATVTPLPAAPPPASAGAISQGPIVSTQGGSRTGAVSKVPAPTPPPQPAPPPPGSGAPVAQRTITLGGFTAAGGYTTLAARTITLSGFTAAGGFASLAARTVTLTGFTAAGLFGSLAPRTITLSGFTATGGFVSLAPRTIALSGFSATGGFTSLAPRTITLSGFAAQGGFSNLAPRTITLSGFTAAGSFVTLAPRTITLSGFTAVGVIP